MGANKVVHSVLFGVLVFAVACKEVAPGSDAGLGGTTQTQALPMNPMGGGEGGGGLGGESGSIEGSGDPKGGEGGYIAPNSLLFCGDTGQIVLQKGQGTLLTWSYPNGYVPSVALSFSLESDPANLEDKGSVSAVSVLSAWYQAPAQVAAEASINVRAHLGDATTPSICRIRLVPDDGFGVEDDGTTRGAVGNVYVLPENTEVLPDFSVLTPLSQIVVPNFDIPTRAFSEGFPGVPDLFEWFGIVFRGQLVIPTTGAYEFRLISDDGSKLWINDILLINNDGTHPPALADGAMMLTAGTLPLRLEYFQGPRYHIALQLYWKGPSDADYVLIPPDNILRPAP